MPSTLAILWKHETDLRVWEQAETYYDRFFRNDEQRRQETLIEAVPDILKRPDWADFDWYALIHDTIIPWFHPANPAQSQNGFSQANRNRQAVNQQVVKTILFCQQGIHSKADIRQALEMILMSHIAPRRGSAILTALFPTEFCIFSQFTEGLLALTGSYHAQASDDLEKAVELIHQVRNKSQELMRFVLPESTWLPTPRRIEKVLFALRDNEAGKGIFTFQERFLKRVEASGISSKFPLPIAKVFHQIEYIHELAEVLIVSNILFAFLHYLASIFIMEYLYSSAQNRIQNDLLFNRAEHQSFGRPMSTGTFAHWCRTILKLLKHEKIPLTVPELGVLFDNHDTDIGKLISMRNNMVKNRLVIEDLRVLLPVYKLGLIELLEKFKLLSQFPILVTDAQAGLQQPYQAMGWNTLQPIPQEVAASLPHTNCILLNPDQRRTLSLYPFYLFAACPEQGCEKQHLFYLAQVDAKKKRVHYISPEGHELSEAQAYRDLESLLAGHLPSDFALASP